MQVEEYKHNENENSDYKPEIKKFSKHPDETTIEFVDLRKEPKFEIKSYLKKLSIDFIRAFGFKILFKLARNLDKSNVPRINLNKLINITLNYGNVKYGLFIVIIKILFKLLRQFLYYTKLQDVMEYKRINFLFGLITNLIMFPLGRNSPLTFYTCLFFLLQSLFFFFRKHLYGASKRLYSESKQFYYIALSLGFITLSLINNETRNNIKLVKYFIYK